MVLTLFLTCSEIIKTTPPELKYSEIMKKIKMKHNPLTHSEIISISLGITKGRLFFQAVLGFFGHFIASHDRARTGSSDSLEKHDRDKPHFGESRKTERACFSACSLPSKPANRRCCWHGTSIYQASR